MLLCFGRLVFCVRTRLEPDHSNSSPSSTSFLFRLMFYSTILFEVSVCRRARTILMVPFELDLWDKTSTHKRVAHSFIRLWFEDEVCNVCFNEYTVSNYSLSTHTHTNTLHCPIGRDWSWLCTVSNIVKHLHNFHILRNKPDTFRHRQIAATATFTFLADSGNCRFSSYIGFFCLLYLISLSLRAE